MAGLVGIIVGTVTLVMQLGAIRAFGLEQAQQAELVVRSCVLSAVSAAWIAIDRADLRAGKASPRTLVAVPVVVLLIALVMVRIGPRILGESALLVKGCGGLAALAGGVVGLLPVLGRGYVAPPVGVLLVTAGEQLASLMGAVAWTALPIGTLAVLAVARVARRSNPWAMALAAGAPLVVAALAAGVERGVVGASGPAQHRLWWLAAGCVLAGLLGLTTFLRPAPPEEADGPRARTRRP
ncbi:hypothetical protein GCM10009678_50600 [Actinomadura kijaniata]|uniref:Uncharacterized protein n=1 Tax=Actinomadura namibiensis TaxID=182080 RepID=A0A7W3LI67_ACTNM|nr:hypothetical protein [Actinomadura namibiensis]MBA8948570.1 hypothetical protein [Actinomadura namibiensis]